MLLTECKMHKYTMELEIMLSFCTGNIKPKEWCEKSPSWIPPAVCLHGRSDQFDDRDFLSSLVHELIRDSMLTIEMYFYIARYRTRSSGWF